MNDRRRTIERYKRKNKRVRFQENSYFCLNDLENKIVSIIEQAADIVIKTTKEYFGVIINTVQTMSEDEYIKLLKDAEPELTIEQMEMLKRIRGGANGRKTDKA